MNAKPKCRDRIMACLKFAAKSPQQVATELFLPRIAAELHLAILLHDGKVFRKFYHNQKTNRPDYFYSSIRFPAYYVPPDNVRKARSAQALLGDWDAMLPVRKQ